MKKKERNEKRGTGEKNIRLQTFTLCIFFSFFFFALLFLGPHFGFSSLITRVVSLKLYFKKFLYLTFSFLIISFLLFEF